MKKLVMAPGIRVGDYITTNKPNDVWWKVLSITEDKPGECGNVYRFWVVNKFGYERELHDSAGTNRKLYRWISAC